MEEARTGVPAPLVARAVLATVLCGFFVVAVLNLIFYADVERVSVAVAVVLLVAMFGLQVGYFGRPRPPGRLRYAALLAHTALVYAPLAVFGQAWIGTPGFLVGSVLLVLRTQVAVPAAAAVVASVAVVQATSTGLIHDVVYSTVSAVITGMVTWGLTWLSWVVHDLQQTRLAIARLEVSRERLRIAQDLHDGLSATMTAITLRTELLRRRIPSDADGVEIIDSELGDIAKLSRTALTDVRTVASTPLRSTVAEEIRHARALLDAAGVTTSVDGDLDVLPAITDAAMAPVLRESVTNVLRHGGGKRCSIAVTGTGDQVALTVRNDRDVDAPLTGSGGQGIDNMRSRVERLGGTLHAGPTDNGDWAVVATIPTGQLDRPRRSSARQLTGSSERRSGVTS